nr:retrovirus-related Pol polyprotein from transposon TNT 1-94 [Tanacetum cinerariifolium]
MSNTNNNLQTRTSNTLHNAIMEVGGKDRPPMLAPGNNVQWKSRIKRYIDTKPNHELIHYCLKNPPYKFTWADKVVPVSEGSPETTAERHMETYKNVSQDIRDQLNAEAEAGKSIDVQDLETSLYWEFGKFTSKDGESLESYYLRFYKMMNELVRNQCDVTNHQVNVQFLLQLQPEWQRFVTLGKQSQELKTVSYHKLYDILKQHQNEVNEIRAERIARNVARARETVGTMVVQKSGIQCYNCKEFRHVTRECQKPKRAKDATYHREKMLLYQELEAHYMYMAQIQELIPDATNDSGPIFDTKPLQKVQNNDHYNVFAIESEHPKQSKYVNDTYSIEQDKHNVIIDSLDMSYDREQIDQNDDDDLANECELLASLIEKLKCEINDSKNGNKFLETSNKVFVDKLKGEIEDFKTKNKSLESSNNHFKEVNNKLLETNELTYKDLKKFQEELDRRNDVEYASKVEIDCAKAKGDLILYKMESQKSFNKYTQQINDLNQMISEMKKELSAHQETISILSQAKEAQIKLYKTRKDKELDKESFNKQTTLLEKRMDESISYDQKCKSSKELLKIKRSVGTIIDGVERCKETIAKRNYFGHIDPFIQNTIEANFCLEIQRISADLEKFHFCLKEEMVADLRYINSIELEVDSLRSQLETQKIQILNEIDRLLKEYYYDDHVNAILGVYTELDEVTNLQSDYLEMLKKCECLEKELSKSKMMSKSFEALQKHAINLELELQQCQEKIKNDKSFKESQSKEFCKERKQYFEIQDLKAQLQDIGIAIVASESINQKPRNTTRMLYELVSKACSWWYPKFTPPGYKWEPKSQIKNVNPNLIEIILFIIDFGCSKHMTGNLKLLINFVEKFLGTVKFRNDQIASILGYGDIVQGAVTIKRVYYIEGLNHNLFSVGQFCEADLEVVFRKSTCYIRELKGNDLLTGSRSTDLYLITLHDTSSPNPICLMAKATSSQAWFWHQRLSHLNFDTINMLSKNDIVIGLPKLKFIKDHLCSSSSINGKKYVLVIVDDYSRYTWTHFLRSKDETPEVLIDFLRLVQRGLHAQEEAGIQLNAEQADWRDYNDDELKDQELEAHYMYMAQLQEVFQMLLILDPSLILSQCK